MVVGRVFPAVRDVPPYRAWLCGSRGRSPSSTQGRAWMSTGGRVSSRAETLSQKGEKCGRTESAAPQAAGASAVDPYYLLPLTYYLFVPALVGFRHNDRLLLRFRIDRVDLIL